MLIILLFCLVRLRTVQGSFSVIVLDDPSVHKVMKLTTVISYRKTKCKNNTFTSCHRLR